MKKLMAVVPAAYNSQMDDGQTSGWGFEMSPPAHLENEYLTGTISNDDLATLWFIEQK